MQIVKVDTKKKKLNSEAVFEVCEMFVVPDEYIGYASSNIKLILGQLEVTFTTDLIEKDKGLNALYNELAGLKARLESLNQQFGTKNQQYIEIIDRLLPDKKQP